MFVKAVEGGADWKGSTKMSLGEMVWIELGTEWGLMAVKALAGASQGLSCWRPANKLAPESNELLLFKSGLRVSWRDRLTEAEGFLPAMVAAFAALWICGMAFVLLENRGTGGRCCDCLLWKAVEEVGAEFA